MSAKYFNRTHYLKAVRSFLNDGETVRAAHFAARVAEVEVENDMANGTLPADVQRFTDLHDHANCYGGMFELQLTPANDVAFMNAVQNRIDARLRAGKIKPQVWVIV